MTDPQDKRRSLPQPASGSTPPVSNPVESAMQITLCLPLDVVAALHQLVQSPQNQPPDQPLNPPLNPPLNQQIVALLRQALGHKVSEEKTPELPLDNQSDTLDSLLQPQLEPHQPQLEQIKQRLSLLEAVLPRLEAMETRLDDFTARMLTPRSNDSVPAEKNPLRQSSVPDFATATVQLPKADSVLEASPHDSVASAPDQPNQDQPDQQKGNPGSAVASIWMQVQQSDRPPASIPSTLQAIEPCSQCDQRMMPFRSSGLMRCIGCGWTRPLSGEAGEAAPVGEGKAKSETPSMMEMPEVDIHQLLERAAAEAMENMKLRKRST